MSIQVLLWIIFNLFVVAMLALDLGVFHRTAHVVHVREALAWCALWVTLALLFNLGIFLRLGSEPALEFLTGYLLDTHRRRQHFRNFDDIHILSLLFTPT